MEEAPVIKTESLSKRYGVLFWKKKNLSLFFMYRHSK